MVSIENCLRCRPMDISSESSLSAIGRWARPREVIHFCSSYSRPLIVPTRDGWKMISAYETLQKIIRKAWAANEERLNLPPLPRDVLGWDDDDPNRPKGWEAY